MSAAQVDALFAAFAAFFLALGAIRALGSRRWRAQARTWLLLGALFAAVAAWLWLRSGR